MMPSPLQRSMRWMRGMMLKHMPLMITCRQFEDFILAYLEGELPEKQRFVFELPLTVCRECRASLAAYRRTIEISKRVFENPDLAVPDEVPEDLVKAVLDARNC